MIQSKEFQFRQKAVVVSASDQDYTIVAPASDPALGKVE
jgi:hypothetical protein